MVSWAIISSSLVGTTITVTGCLLYTSDAADD